MPKLFNKILGISLFEVMLVLLITAIATVSGLQYMKHQSEITAANLYGQNLYTFGQAVNSYLSSATNLYTMGGLPNAAGTGLNPAVTKTTNGTQVTLTATGVKWLQQANAGVSSATKQAYLTDAFSFVPGMSPLMIATPDAQGAATSTTGDAAISTTITFDTSTPTVPPTVKISTGVLYEQAIGKGQPQIKPDLTQTALQHANSMYSPNLGLPVFSFAASYINAQGQYNAAATGTGTTNQANAGGAYLMVVGADNGGNSMLGQLNFNVQNGGTINNVGTMNMNTTNPSGVQINFPYTGSINNLGSLTMGQTWNNINTGPMLTLGPRSITFPLIGPSPGLQGNVLDMGMHDIQGGLPNGTPTTITGLTNLTFDGSTVSALTGLQTITFNSNAGVINNLKNSPVFKGVKISAYALDSNKTAQTDAFLGSHNVCFLTGAGAITAGITCAVDGKGTWAEYAKVTTSVFNVPATSDLATPGLTGQATNYFLHRINSMTGWCYAVCLDWST